MAESIWPAVHGSDNNRCLRVSVHGQRVSHAEVQDERICRDAGRHVGSHQNEGYSSHSQQRGTSCTVWWNKQMRECVAVGTRDGNVDIVRSVGENECQ